MTISDVIRGTFRLLSMCVVIVCVYGCSSPRAYDVSESVLPLNTDSRISIKRYHKYSYDPEHRKFGAFGLSRSLLFFELGDYYDADRWFGEMCREMDQIAGDGAKELYALTIDEAAKVYRGEPYERATAYFYRGLCRINLGDWEGALAAFRHSLADDAETRTNKQEYREDYSVSYFMVALCYLRLGERDNAEQALQAAKKHRPNNKYLTTTCLNHNFAAIVAIGEGPYRKTDGKTSCGPCPETKVEIYLNNELLGETAEITDLMVQARTNKQIADTLRGTRVVGKSVLYAFTGYMIPEYIDTRYWFGLPQKFMLLTARVPEGKHQIGLKFYDKKGKHLERYDQVWYEIPINEDQTRVCYFRSKKDLHDCSGKKQQKIEHGRETGA